MTRWLVTFAAGLGLMSPASACTIIYAVVKTGPDFRVEVVGQGHPATGVTVVLSRDTSIVSHTVTNKDGVAYFRNVAPGAYHLSSASHRGIDSDGAWVDVSRSGPSGTALRLNWRDRRPIQTRSLKGQVRVPTDIRENRRPVMLEIRDRKSARVLRSIELAASGDFDLANIGPGIYLLRVQSRGSRFDGQTAVEVNPKAANAALDIDVGTTGCGSHFIDQNACPRAALSLMQLSGVVNDASGASISRASLTLLDGTGRIIATRTSGELGEIAAFQPPDGFYRLDVRGLGFTPLRTTLTVSPDGPATPLVFTLGVMGACSKVGPR